MLQQKHVPWGWYIGIVTPHALDQFYVFCETGVSIRNGSTVMSFRYDNGVLLYSLQVGEVVCGISDQRVFFDSYP